MNISENQKIMATKHWLFQVVPPLLMPGILFTTDKGSALVFLAGIFILPVLVSIISIIAKLIFFKKKKYYLLRPMLTIAMFILILNIAGWSYNIALEQASEAAKVIHTACNKNLNCPKNPKGWQVNKSRIQKNDLGNWLTYSASYYYKHKDFTIRVYQGPDLGDIITGGVNVPFKIERYKEN